MESGINNEEELSSLVWWFAPFHLISWNCGVSLKDGANLDHGVGGVGLNHGVGDVNFDHNAPPKLEEDLPNDGSFKLMSYI